MLALGFTSVLIVTAVLVGDLDGLLVKHSALNGFTSAST